MNLGLLGKGTRLITVLSRGSEYYANFSSVSECEANDEV